MISKSAQEAKRAEHILDKRAQRVIQADPFGGLLTEGNFTVTVEESGDTTYVGKAQIGTPQADTGWQIMRIVETGGVTAITWAGATDEFTKVWASRGTYAYS